MKIIFSYLNLVTDYTKNIKIYWKNIFIDRRAFLKVRIHIKNTNKIFKMASLLFLLWNPEPDIKFYTAKNIITLSKV